ncbi:MAG: aminoglycoside phosphotransferase, partial [Muribaculaceae bacterium]|nr:aminoglycoside phosphotransferase [Muribaculaceae bacterium]
MKDFSNIVNNFAIKGRVESVKPLGNGLINDTYIVKTSDESTSDYVLQRINHHIFTDVDTLQDNIAAVTS